MTDVRRLFVHGGILWLLNVVKIPLVIIVLTFPATTVIPSRGLELLLLGFANGRWQIR
jgi:hypothetical protein